MLDVAAETDEILEVESNDDFQFGGDITLDELASVYVQVLIARYCAHGLMIEQFCPPDSLAPPAVCGGTDDVRTRRVRSLRRQC